jgi:NhaA family Na+:H+ antiporter
MPVRLFREFLKLESSAGILLFFSAMLAIVVHNIPGLQHYYEHFFALPLSFHIGDIGLSKPILLWVNDGLMAVFFFLIGLEIKREFLVGELRSLQTALLPAIGAFGGMAGPALVYWAFTHHDAFLLKGWAIPTATDIAFTLGVLSLLGSRIPTSLKVFLTALAIFDDLGAIVVIALFYTDNISVLMLSLALFCCVVLFIMNRLNVTRIAAYILVGIVMWVCVLKSGVHATLAGILVAFAIPMCKKSNPHIRPLQHLEHRLHPWVAFGVLPIFAFANAGVKFAGLNFSHLVSPLPLAIGLGLFIGKQLGIWGCVMAAVRCGVAYLPRGVTALGMYGASALAGIGFTMSLFIATLAFGEAKLELAPLIRFGVLAGSLLSGILGYLILHLLHPSSDK